MEPKFHLIKLIIIFLALSVLAVGSDSRTETISEDSEACIECHLAVTPGIVGDWNHSLHSQITPMEALQKDELARRVSSVNIPENLQNVSVGCAECHMLNPDSHKDSFEHADYIIHTVVTPEDCATCHQQEVVEYADNLMSQANLILTQNDLYRTMINESNGVQHFSGSELTADESDQLSDNTACLSCHGTEVKVDGMETRETDFGEMEFPRLTGWPNQGVGRINPDESVGSCTSCHARHQFSIEMARKPYTCSECHKGPDVPAYKVYQVSKHGNIYSSIGDRWDFSSVPWTVGEDFTAPTCAVCHISLIVDSEGEEIVKRTHRMNDRLDNRLFGLIYSHPHPISANTSNIKNKDGIPLPTELSGEPVAEFLIDEQEKNVRRDKMKSVCGSCHTSGWVNGHFAKLDHAIETTNAMTLAATKIMSKIWEEGLVDGLPQGASIFDDAVEKKWVEQWLFYANSVRFAAAMSGADYGVFANGRWYQSKNLRELEDWYQLHTKLK